jgi:purine-nucleoside/S-methyl-5'-thioadenosine phosphorylase / adenosine deaminase
LANSSTLTQHIYRAPALSQLDWLDHGFGNRHFERPATFTTVHQIHSDIAVHADRPRCPPDGDALLSDTPGRIVAVKTADCVPILLADARHRAVAAVHAGWRGTASRIVQKTIGAMAARWDTRAPDLHAAIGPAIGVCCYEVGPEVAVQFTGLNQRAHVDLEDENRRQLLAAGLDPLQIWAAGLCTFCGPEAFHSFRRDREAAGRMISFIGVRAQPPSPGETSAGIDRPS